eukprot:351342-Chlamydomonas_euryale.AAC.8
MFGKYKHEVACCAGCIHAERCASDSGKPCPPPNAPRAPRFTRIKPASCMQLLNAVAALHTAGVVAGDALRSQRVLLTPCSWTLVEAGGEGGVVDGCAAAYSSRGDRIGFGDNGHERSGRGWEDGGSGHDCSGRGWEDGGSGHQCSGRGCEDGGTGGASVCWWSAAAELISRHDLATITLMWQTRQVCNFDYLVGAARVPGGARSKCMTAGSRPGSFDSAVMLRTVHCCSLPFLL